jgi:hypothetical protein
MRIEIQGGETLETADEESFAKILASFHLEGKSMVTVYADDAASLSAFGCISDGFGVSYKCSKDSQGYSYCPAMLDLNQTKAIFAAFAQGDGNWKEKLVWKQSKPSVDIFINAVVVVVIISIGVLFLKEAIHWFKGM